MANVRKDFSFDGLKHTELLARYNSLREIALSKGQDVETDVLREMVALCAVLRRGSKLSGPPRTARTKSIPTLDDL